MYNEIEVYNMESQRLSFQFTAFANIDIENAKALTKSFGENYIKNGLPVTNVKGAPLFRVESLSRDESINISLERIDCFYNSDDISCGDRFLGLLSKFNNLHLLEISRLAINYIELFLDSDFALVKKLNKYFRFVDVFGNSQEIMFRLNNIQSFKDVDINVITNLQSGSMTNNMTFEDVNGVVVHYDINNKPIVKFDFNEVATFINKLYLILQNQRNTISELLSNE